jgi:hypothetical protein
VKLPIERRLPLRQRKSRLPVCYPTRTSFNSNGGSRPMASIEDLCRELRGCRLTDVSWDGVLWYFSAENDLAIMTQHQWRLIGDGQILLSNKDYDDDETPEAFSQRVTGELTESIITWASCNIPTGDLTLLFENGRRLEFLNYSVGFCDWVGALDDVVIVRRVAA